MKASPQITMLEPRMRMPVWRRASPKYWKTRPFRTWPAILLVKPKISPAELSHSRGTAVQPAPIYLRPPRFFFPRPHFFFFFFLAKAEGCSWLFLAPPFFFLFFFRLHCLVGFAG